MKTLHVDAPGGRYPIRIGCGVVEGLGRCFGRSELPSAFHVVSDATVAARHGDRLRKVLARLGRPVTETIVKPGERSKSTSVLERVWRDATRAGVDRSACIVAFGGGVVGDLAGMAAATLLRGVRLVQVPTTLLAMVDSSVGGKTGINLPEGKNLVGCFYQPVAVLADLDFLKTLPRRELAAGWAEIIKAAAIRDARLFRRLERDAKTLSRSRSGELESVVRAACKIKAEVVSADEREAGLRMILNFGHTLAHGLEAAGKYGALLHGECVAIGMHFAARLGLAMGNTAPEVPARLVPLLRAYGLPVRWPASTPIRAARVLEAMARDKKKAATGLRWVFVPRLGQTSIATDVPWSTTERAVRGFLSEDSVETVNNDISDRKRRSTS